MTQPEDSKIDSPENAENIHPDDENVEALEDTLEFSEPADSKLKEAEDRAVRLQAELENFRRRKTRESQEQLKFAAMPIITSLLEVVDNLHRALSAAEDDASAGALREGVDMVANQLQSVLENHGCKKIEAVGQPFDPNLHEAIQMQPSDTIEAKHVMQEVQTGYTLHDRVVRPSKVMVSTGPA